MKRKERKMKKEEVMDGCLLLMILTFIWVLIGLLGVLIWHDNQMIFGEKTIMTESDYHAACAIFVIAIVIVLLEFLGFLFAKFYKPKKPPVLPIVLYSI